MSMRKKQSGSIVRCGREITAGQLEAARETVQQCRGLSRAELAETICEHWGWVTASGTGKVTGCLRVLEELEREGEIQLPARRKIPKTERVRGAKHTERTAPPDEGLRGKLAVVSPVEMEMVEDRDRVKLWNEYLDRYHYLGYSKPFGCTLPYFIVCERGVLGCAVLPGLRGGETILRVDWIGLGHILRGSACGGRTRTLRSPRSYRLDDVRRIRGSGKNIFDTG